MIKAIDADHETPLPECEAGKDAFKKFDATVNALLSVPRAEMQRRMEAYKEESAKNPNRRGPKPKVKRRGSSASRAAKRT